MKFLINAQEKGQHAIDYMFLYEWCALLHEPTMYFLLAHRTIIFYKYVRMALESRALRYIDKSNLAGLCLISPLSRIIGDSLGA